MKPVKSVQCVSSDCNEIGACYVDDLVISAKNDGLIQKLKRIIRSTLILKYLGIPAQVLNIKIHWSTLKVALERQTVLINKFLISYEVKNARPVDSPLFLTQKIRKHVITLVEYKVNERGSVVGRILNPAIKSRPYHCLSSSILDDLVETEA